MAGLLAANMLRRFQPTVYELQDSLPNNHDALLRFRTDKVSRATGIPFKKVLVSKMIKWNDLLIDTPSIKLSNLYAYKVTGEYRSRSIMNLEPVERFIAPPDFISQMANSVDVQYGSGLSSSDLTPDDKQPLISTIPMPALMEIAKWKERPEFNFRSIYTLSADIEEPRTDLYQTIYYASPHVPWYRASITGKHVQVEMMDSEDSLSIPNEKSYNDVIQIILEDFGIRNATLHRAKLSFQKYGKITPIPDKARKSFILFMTDIHGLYSLGRFATWRQILMDDVVDDVQFIESCVTQRDAYQQRIATINR
jgi:hypothetical protein